MTESGKSVYKICREQAGYTLEQAAELLHCSVRALCRYESGEAPPPNDIVTQMALLYNDTYVMIAHLRDSSPIAAQIIPQVEPCGLQTAAIRLFDRMAAWWAARPDRQVLQIAEDGVVSPEERRELDGILEDLQELTKVFTELRLAAERDT